MALAAAGVDFPLKHAMAVIGPFYRADRAWIGYYNEELTHHWGCTEWLNTGIPSHLEDFQCVPVEFLGDAHHKLVRGEPVIIPDVERMPRQSRALQAELRREGVRATFAHPLRRGGKLIGIFGVDYVHDLAAWTEQDLKRLTALEEYLAALMHRHLNSAPSGTAAAPPRSAFVTGQGSLNALVVEEVVYIEADGDYTHVHLADGRSHFERRSLRSWVGQLPKDGFLRVHQSYLVSATRILRLDRGTHWTLHLQGVSKPIPVGRSFRHALRLHMAF